MLTSKKLRAALCAALIAFQATPPAIGGALTGGATEWTQIANNVQLWMQYYKQIEAVTKLAQSYIVQYKTLEQQILNGLVIEGISLADVLKVKRDIEAYQSHLKALGRDIKGLGGYFDRRLVEARLLNLPMEEYVRREAQKIESGNQTAKARLERERNLMEQVKADIGRVDEFSSRIATTAGTHQATQLMNSQLNLLLQQMGRLTELTAEAQGSDQATTLNEIAEARERNQARNKLLYDKDAEMRLRDQAGFDAMKRHR